MVWRLLSADIWRDGGSYSAVLESDGRRVALWLQVLHWDHPSEVRHGALYVSCGNDPERREARVPPLGEHAWFEVLRDADAREASENARSRAAKLAYVLQLRCEAG